MHLSENRVGTIISTVEIIKGTCLILRPTGCLSMHRYKNHQLPGEFKIGVSATFHQSLPVSGGKNGREHV